jgi:rsbT co-antagonist protein RsbR
MSPVLSRIPEILTTNEDEVLSDWMRHMPTSTRRSDLISENELEQQSRELLRLITAAAHGGNLTNFDTDTWRSVDNFIQAVSDSRAKLGFSPSDTATYILSLKQPLFTRIRARFGKDADALFEELWAANLLLDKIALLSTDAFIASREQIIRRQQEDMLELSTPVVKLWDGVLALPVIGTLDSARTQVVMESLLQTIVETNSRVAIIDITGVPTVDTLVAQHLLKTITAARLMGAECIISGVRPQIAQTIIHLGINLNDVITKAKLSDAFALALQRLGKTVCKVPTSSNTRPTVHKEKDIL